MDVFPHQVQRQPRPCWVKHSRTLLNPPANTEQYLAPTKHCICSQKENIMYLGETCFIEHKNEPSVASIILLSEYIYINVYTVYSANY